MLIYETQRYTIRDDIKAYLFGVSLIVLLGFFILTSVTSAGPIILGSELNGNGTMEYMCLGTGCDSFNNFSWSDK